jgi:predicted ATPase
VRHARLEKWFLNEAQKEILPGQGCDGSLPRTLDVTNQAPPPVVLEIGSLCVQGTVAPVSDPSQSLAKRLRIAEMVAPNMMMEVLEDDQPSGRSVNRLDVVLGFEVAVPEQGVIRVWKKHGDSSDGNDSAGSVCCSSSTGHSSDSSTTSPCHSLRSVVDVQAILEEQDGDVRTSLLLPHREFQQDGGDARAHNDIEEAPRRRSLDPRAFRQCLQSALYAKNQQVEVHLRSEVVARLRSRRHSSQDDALEPRVPSPPLVLVSGPLGSGKSHLAQSLRHLVEDELGGYFVTGRCDSGCCDENDDNEGANQSAPYPALVSALEEFAGAVLRRGPEEVSRIRDAIKASVGIESFVLTRFLPSLRQILGNEQSNPAGHSVSEVDDGQCGSHMGGLAHSNTHPPSSDSVLRFMYVFGNFFRAISSAERPFVMLVDDLHDCDPCSLSILGSVLANAATDSPGFLVVGSIQPDRVSGDSILACKLRELEDVDNGIEIPHFPLSNLEPDELCEAFSGLLNVDEREVNSLAAQVYQCTAGNPFHVSEVMSFLEEVGLVSLENGHGVDCWDDEKVDDLLAVASSLDALLNRKLRNVSQECQEVLKVASCLGSELDEELIGYALGYAVQHWLPAGEAAGLLTLERWGQRAEPRYRFANASVRRAARGLIESDRQASFHLDLARRIWRCCDEASTEKYLYTVLSLFQKGKSLIERPNDRHAVSALCYHAGFMAARASSFRVASHYFDLGIDILGPNRWRENYELSLSLCNAASEMDMCSGNFSSMEAHLSDVLARARLYKDTIQARATKIYYYGTSAAYQGQAVEEGFKVLNELGVDLPSRVSKVRLARELFRVRRALQGRTDSSILRMPTLANVEKRSCLQILSLVYQNAMFARPNLLPIVILRMIDITLQYGLSEFASIAFTNYGVLCIETTGDTEMGYRYGSLGLAILDRFKANELVPRVYGAFYKHIYVHTKPVKGTLQPLAKAYRIGLYTGDLDAAFLCAIYFCLNSFDAGVPLPAIEVEYSDIIRRMEASRQKSMLTTTLPLSQCIRDLMGLSDDPLSSKGDLINHDELMQSSEKAGRPLVVSAMLACRLTLGNVLNEFDFVSTFLDEFVEKYVYLIPVGSTRTHVMMSAGLCAVELARLGRSRRRNVRIAKSMIAKLRKCAQYNPQYALDKLFLVQAELASYQRHWSRARRKYLSAIALSVANESRYSCAKANECFARHVIRTAGDDPESERDGFHYFVDACQQYKEWGAAAKVVRLEREMQELFPHQECHPSSRPKVRPSLKANTPLDESLLYI